MIRGGLLLAVLAALTGGDFVKAPAGWTNDVEGATALTEKTNKLTHFGGNAPVLASAQIYIANDGPGGLYVIGVAAKLTEHRDAAARVAFDSFLGAPQRAELTNSVVSIKQSGGGVDDEGKQIEATLQWQDTTAGTITNARLVIAADAENLIAVTGECVLSPDSTPATVDACAKALASLDAGIALDKRVALALAAAGTEPPPGPDRPSAMSSPTMSDGSRTPMPPITLPPAEPKRTVDRRPVYVGAGLVVLAGLFWWNRRRRERTESSGTGTVKKDTDE